MSDKTKKTFPKIRTFARDMEEVRKKHDEVSSHKTNKEGVEKENDTKKKIKEEEEIEISNEKSTQKPAAGEHTTRQTIGKKPEKIPAFHELKTETKELDLEQKSKKGESSQTNLGYGATIITDTKKNEVKLIPSVTIAIKKWFEKVTKPKKKKVPKYTIPETSRRKGVIQKATSKTGSIFTADNDTIKEQIRKRRLLERNKEGVKREKDDEPETNWSPYTETGFNLLEGDVTQNVKIEFKKRSTSTPENKNISYNLDSTEKEKNENEEGLPDKKAVPKEEEIEEIKKTEEIKEEKEKNENEEIEEIKETEIKDQISEEKIYKFDISTLTIIILTLVVTTVLIIFSGQISLKFANTENSSSIETKKVLENSSLETVTLSSETIEALPKLIKSKTESTGEGLSEIVITSITGTEVGAAYIVDILDFNTIPALNKSLTNIRFVTIDDSKDIILLKFIDETTVLGGLLYWEPNMANDLKTLLSLSSTEGDFKDKTIRGVDFRELRNRDTNDLILVYGIIDEKTAIITTSETTLVKILQTEFSN